MELNTNKIGKSLFTGEQMISQAEVEEMGKEFERMRKEEIVERLEKLGVNKTLLDNPISRDRLVKEFRENKGYLYGKVDIYDNNVVINNKELTNSNREQIKRSYTRLSIGENNIVKIEEIRQNFRKYSKNEMTEWGGMETKEYIGEKNIRYSRKSYDKENLRVLDADEEMYKRDNENMRCMDVRDSINYCTELFGHEIEMIRVNDEIQNLKAYKGKIETPIISMKIPPQNNCYGSKNTLNLCHTEESNRITSEFIKDGDIAKYVEKMNNVQEILDAKNENKDYDR